MNKSNKISFFYFVTFVCTLFNCANAVPCPFTPSQPDGIKCDCYGGDQSGKRFQNASCQFDTYQEGIYPKFDTDINQYVIKEKLLLQDSSHYPEPERATKMRALSFLAFKSIGLLELEETDISYLHSTLQWNENAFQGLYADILSVKNYVDIFPIPPAIRNFGKSGLPGLRFSHSKNPVTLDANAFKDLLSLSVLAIDQTPITAINDSAFLGLESTLIDLSLTAAAILTYPTNALRPLKKLKRLNLSGNEMNGFPASAFTNFTDLEELRLSDNNIKPAINAGAFTKLPPKLTTLTIDGGRLNVIPSDMLSATPQITYLSMANNMITQVNTDDFPATNRLTYLSLSGNPISTIENGALKNLTMVQELQLKDTNLESIDLALFNGMNALTYLALDQSDSLEALQISSIDQVPPNLNRITVTLSNLKTIDSKFGALLTRSNFEMLDLANNTDITCDKNLLWAAKFALCNPVRLRIDNDQCANIQSKSFNDYLKESVPNPCQ